MERRQGDTRQLRSLHRGGDINNSLGIHDKENGTTKSEKMYVKKTKNGADECINDKKKTDGIEELFEGDGGGTQEYRNVGTSLTRNLLLYNEITCFYCSRCSYRSY